jgi:FdhD protein
MTGPLQAQALETRYGAGPDRAIVRELASEVPVAIECNGVAYAVMMATPVDLEDYAIGFALSEGLIAVPQDARSIAIAEVEGGWIVRIQIDQDRAAPFLDRVRLRVVEGSCGLCGMESIEQVLRPLPQVSAAFHTSPVAVQVALEHLPALQPVGARTGAMHAAAFCLPDGSIVAVREDIGRHNALDKLIGALAREGIAASEGFILVSARCSFELVEKTVRAGCPMLVAISAPSDLAVERAKMAGLTLVALARGDSMLVFNDPRQMLGEVHHGI